MDIHIRDEDGFTRMATPAQAVLALRHVVQEHGDEHTVIGRPASLPGIVWLGGLLGWQWPPSYLHVLEEHDGVQVQFAHVFSFLESCETLLILHDRWHRSDGYWPVASDGCGNYHALALGEYSAGGECQVVFFEMIQSSEEPQERVADTYADFLVGYMAEQCETAGCSELRLPSSTQAEERGDE